MHNLADVAWVAACARRLRERWPRADPTSVEETAAELALDDQWRSQPPVKAAEQWLSLGAP